MKRFLHAIASSSLVLSLAPALASAQWVPNGRLVSASTGTHRCSAIVADGAGGAYVVWQEWSGSYPDAVHVSRVVANGATAPGSPLIVAGPGGTPYHFGAGGDGAGGVAIAWGVSGSNQVQLTRIQADGSPVAGWPTGGNSYTLPAPTLDWDADGFGGGWFHYRLESSFCPLPSQCNYNSDAFAKHVSSVGVLNAGEFHIISSSYPSGAIATVDGAAPGSALAHAYNESMTGWVARVDLAQTLVWGFLLDFNHAQVHAAMEDGSGGALVVTEGAFGSLAPRLLRIDAGGGAYPGWPSGGAAIRVPDAAMGGLTATHAGGASAIVAWTEYDPAGTKVKVQKLTSAGAIAPGWPADGLVACDAPSSRDLLVLAPDGTGGALLAWRDARSEAVGDLYATHVTAAGALDPTYATNGTGIATLPGGIQNLMLTPVGGGNAIVAWTDLRTGSEVYAQKLPLPGSAGVGEGSMRGLALAGFVPNPAAALPRVAFTLAKEADATLELFDLVGRRVHVESWSGLAAGPHEFGLRPVRPLTPGIYLLRLRAAGEAQIRRGLVSR